MVGFFGGCLEGVVFTVLTSSSWRKSGVRTADIGNANTNGYRELMGG